MYIITYLYITENWFLPGVLILLSYDAFVLTAILVLKTTTGVHKWLDDTLA